MAGQNPFTKTLPLTSLGAVGGPRGTAAGALRILVDFAVNYDAQKIQVLEEQVKRLQDIEARANQRQNQYLQQQAALEAKINTVRENRRQLTRDEQRRIDDLAARYKRMYDVQAKLDRSGITSPLRQAAIQREKAYIDGQVAGLVRQGGLTENQLRQLTQMLVYKKQLVQVGRNIEINEESINNLLRAQSGLVQEVGAIQQFRDRALPSLLGLGVGAVGNIFGGALLAVGFEAGQAAVDKFTEALRDAVDPANHARDAIGDLNSALEAMGSDETLSGLERANLLLDKLQADKITIPTKGGSLDILLDIAQRTQRLNDIFTQYTELLGQAAYGTDVYSESLNKLGNLLLQHTPEFAALVTALQNAIGYFNSDDLFKMDPEELQKLVDAGKLSKDVVDNFLRARDASTDLAIELGGGNEELAKAKANAEALADALERATNEALDKAFDRRMQDIADTFEANADRIRATAQTAIDNLSAAADASRQKVNDESEARINKLQDRLSGLRSTPSGKTRRLQAAVGNVGDQESARTRALQAQIDRLNEAQERRAYLAQLADIAEARYELKLAHHLETSKKAIDIYKYAGKARVIAIDASIARLQKQQQEQDRLNKLLDLEYEASKRINREEGESIQDFLARRAQEYRHQIADRMDLERQGKEDRLGQLKDETEYRIQLAENEQARRKAIQDREQKLYMDHLQKLLGISKDADRAAAQAQRDRLQKQLQASQEADRRELDRKRKHVQDLIDQERKHRDSQIKMIDAAEAAAKKALDAARDAQLKANDKAKDAAEKAERQREDIIKKYANRSETDRIIAATKGAKTIAQLNEVAGHLAGANASWAQLDTYIKGLGLSSPESQVLLAGLRAQRAAYSAALARIQGQQHLPPGPKLFAEGGVFEITNAMNFGRNMRAGEQGREIGVILSNRVTQALEARKGGPMVGTINITAQETPQQTVYRLKRTVKELQESQL